MKSSKTTIAGIVAILAAVSQVAITLVNGSVSDIDWNVIVPLVVTAAVGLLARDNDKSSEDVGLK